MYMFGEEYRPKKAPLKKPIFLFLILLVVVLFWLLTFSNHGYSHIKAPRRPRVILLITADSLSWNDIGYHDSDIRTPHLDMLAEQGVKLENYYIQTTSGGTRSQLLTSKYQIHTGLQHGDISLAKPSCLPLEIPTLGNKLQEVGYSTHMVGKWQLGFHKTDCLPTSRGFDTFLGVLDGQGDHYRHESCLQDKCGKDFYRNTNATDDYNGQYSTHIYGKKVQDLVSEAAGASKPVFIYLSFQAPHAPLQVPEKYTAKYRDLKDDKRRIFAGMVSAVDEAVGKIASTCKEKGLWDKTLLIFSTGSAGSVAYGSSHLPLRGGTNTLLQGVVRGVSFVSGGFLPLKKTINNQLIHVSDWYPTILYLTGVKSIGIDGYNIWNTISRQNVDSPRREILLNIDPLSQGEGHVFPNSSFNTRIHGGLIAGNYKLITGYKAGGDIYPETKTVWLYNIKQDPTESQDLSDRMRTKVMELIDRLAHYNATAVKCIITKLDTYALPKYHDGYWKPWGKTTSNDKPQLPHILLILVDDLGWGDVGYHGSDIKTPNIDKLSEEGVRLLNYYVQPDSTGSRSQLLTGKYQIHTGLQHGDIYPTTPYCLPTNVPTIASKLQEAGYHTSIVGKWHLGFYKSECLPTNRGFDTFYGTAGSHGDYYNHTMCWLDICGTDFYSTDKMKKTNMYSTHLYAEQVQHLALQNHRDITEKPLFVYLPFQAVHWPMQVPKQYTQKYKHIRRYTRRLYAGMVTALDEAIGNITKTYKELGMWDNTLLIFSSDNGGSYDFGASNLPFRGGKKSLLEGGIRAPSFVSGGVIPNKGLTSDAMIHISDWFPTIMHVLNINVDDMELDGNNAWKEITTEKGDGRKDLLINIDPMSKKEGVAYPHPGFDTRVSSAIISNSYKLITGYKAGAEKSLAKKMKTTDQTVWLYDLKVDQGEEVDLSLDMPDKVTELLDKLAAYNATSAKCLFQKHDPNAHPKLHEGYWRPWK